MTVTLAKDVEHQDKLLTYVIDNEVWVNSTTTFLYQLIRTTCGLNSEFCQN